MQPSLSPPVSQLTTDSLQSGSPWSDDQARFLAAAGAALASSLDYEQILARLYALAVPYLADWCAVALADHDDAHRRVTLTCADPGRRSLRPDPHLRGARALRPPACRPERPRRRDDRAAADLGLQGRDPGQAPEPRPAAGRGRPRPDPPGTVAESRSALTIGRALGRAIAAASLDLAMPQVDGEQIFHALLRTHPTLPVILMSGLSAKQAAGAIGAQAAFIQKPFSAAGLLALLARTIAAAR